jgi:hypothetical protein
MRTHRRAYIQLITQVAGSNPAPATKKKPAKRAFCLHPRQRTGRFCTRFYTRFTFEASVFRVCVPAPAARVARPDFAPGVRQTTMAIEARVPCRAAQGRGARGEASSPPAAAKPPGAASWSARAYSPVRGLPASLPGALFGRPEAAVDHLKGHYRANASSSARRVRTHASRRR